MLDGLLARIRKSTGQAVAYTLTPWDARAHSVRTGESALGDLIADIMLLSMEEVTRAHGAHGDREIDCCLICGGALRGDTVFGPGKITLGNVLEVLPFEDPVVLVELTGKDIWDALENGFSAYPRQEGRFPQVSGLSVVWDSSRPPGNRVISVNMLENLTTDVACSQYEFHPGEGDTERVLMHRKEPRVRAPLSLDKKYLVVTRQYLAEGNDGYFALTRGKYMWVYANKYQ